MSKPKCEVENCTSPAQFAMYRTKEEGEKVWLHVCREHEREIAKENLARTSMKLMKNGHGRYQYKERKRQDE